MAWIKCLPLHRSEHYPALGGMWARTHLRDLSPKRCIDLTLAAFLLLLTTPVLLVCILLVSLDSPGPAIFRQVRLGRGFRPFRLLKLRTMYAGSEGQAYALSNDPRITRVGRILRRFKLDELPQLFNVLRGDMSLVGPRPVLPSLVDEFRERYTVLLQVRPGLTDPASLLYRREDQLLSLCADPRREFLTVITPEKLRISAEYSQRASLGSDLRVLAQTLAAVLFGIPRRRPVSNPACGLPAAPHFTPEKLVLSHDFALSDPSES